MLSITNAERELQALAQWVCWYVKHEGDRTTKPPINPNVTPSRPLEQRLASPKDATTWGTYEQALHTSRYYAGIGFMFSSSDNLCGIDLDKCRDPQSGQIAEWARQIIALLNSYTEISPSGTGIHIIIHASLITTIEKLGRTRLQHKRGHVEIYDERRYFTLTSNHLECTPTTIEERQDELTDLYQAIFPEQNEHEEKKPQAPASSPLSLSDDWIIERARLMRSGNGAKFERLWRGDASDYRRPDSSIDYSRADQALLGILAYWTGRNAARMEYLFSRSGLYRKDRWRETARDGETYGQGSIRLAILNCRQIYDPAWAEAHRYHPPTKPSKRQETPATSKKEGS